MSRRLLVLRHGRTTWNATGRIQGQMDPPLDETGWAQARQAATAIAALSPACIVSSDLQRALDSATEIGRVAGVRVRADPRLREIWVGSWEGLTNAEARQRFPAEYEAWLGGSDAARGGGETYGQVGERAAAAAWDVIGALPGDGLGVLVTHGGTARTLIGSLLELPVGSWWRISALGNCCWAVLREAERGWRLVEYGVSAAVVEGLSAVEAISGGAGTAPDVEPVDSGQDARP